MKIYLIVLFIILVSLLFFPLSWVEKNNIIINWVKLTEEYYKSWFSLVQLIIGFSFFTLLYNFVNDKKKTQSLKKIKKKIIENINLLKEQNNQSGDEINKTLIKLNSLVSIYIDYLNSSLPDEDDLIIFYEFCKDIKSNTLELDFLLQNPSAKGIRIEKILRIFEITE